LEKDPARRLHDIADARLELDDALTGNADQHAIVSATSPNARAAASGWRGRSLRSPA
jgi:hypothetical protein